GATAHAALVREGLRAHGTRTLAVIAPHPELLEAVAFLCEQEYALAGNRPEDTGEHGAEQVLPFRALGDRSRNGHDGLEKPIPSEQVSHGFLSQAPHEMGRSAPARAMQIACLF